MEQRQRSGQLSGAAVPGIVVELKREFHATVPLYIVVEQLWCLGAICTRPHAIVEVALNLHSVP